jgi:hypothetical protein
MTTDTLMVQRQDTDDFCGKSCDTAEDNGTYHLDQHHSISSGTLTPSVRSYACKQAK